MWHFSLSRGHLLRDDLAMTGSLGLFALANNFRVGYGPVIRWLQSDSRVLRAVARRIGDETVSIFLGMKLVQREALEAKPLASEHGQGGTEATTRSILDGAQRAIKWNGASRKPTGPQRECANVSGFTKAMWPREPTARSGDIAPASVIAHARKSLGLESVGITPF